jgi:hypothetical protein
MENISENKKRGRGRPRIIHPAVASVLDDGQRYTPRQQQNLYHAAMFTTALSEDLKTDFAWLLEKWDTSPRGAGSTILAELGRLAFIDHPDAVGLSVRLARHICQEKMKTTTAIALIRQHRRDMQQKPQPAAQPEKLAAEIIHLMNDYARRHPGMNQRLAMRALEIVLNVAHSTPGSD